MDKSLNETQKPQTWVWKILYCIGRGDEIGKTERNTFFSNNPEAIHLTVLGYEWFSFPRTPYFGSCYKRYCEVIVKGDAEIFVVTEVYGRDEQGQVISEKKVTQNGEPISTLPVDAVEIKPNKIINYPSIYEARG